jgi:exonuclease III
MKIVSWNCKWGLNYGSREGKREVLKKLKQDADILVLQECTKEDFDEQNYPGDRSAWHGDAIDAGDKPVLGVGVFCKDGYSI